MLKELYIRDFALIDQLELSFYSGFSVLTGETGAGKSIIIDALGLLLGQRASLEMVRTGAEQAFVEGSFQPSEAARTLLEEWGMDNQEELIISREIHRSGRNKSRINGRLATLQQLGELAPCLADILGQHGHQSLLQTDKHVDLLDSFGPSTVLPLRSEVSEKYGELQRVRSQQSRLQSDERERLRRLDLLQFQISEIEQAHLVAGEEEALVEERDRLAHAEKLATTTMSVYSQLQESQSEQPALLDGLSNVCHELESVSRYDASLQELAGRFRDAVLQLDDGCRELRGFVDTYQADPEKLYEVETRLSLIYDLQRKYGESSADILGYLEECRREHQELSDSAQTMEYLAAAEKKLATEYETLCDALSKLRRQTAEKMQDVVEAELASLNMEKTRFVVDLSAAEHPTVVGLDVVTFMMSANVGEELKSLAKIASGGEVSRIMLALRTVLAQVDAVPTLVFDEADAGIGGATALQIGEKLRTMSENCQVLSVTHLPVVASYAHCHYKIKKATVDGRTIVEVVKLNTEQRIAELTRMLGGERVEGIPATHAKELLERGRAR